MKNKEGFTRNIFTLVIIIFLSLFSFMVLGEFKTGIGFGKDVRVMIKTKDHDALDAFIHQSVHKGIETRKETIVLDEYYLLTSSYAGPLTSYENELKEAIADIDIIHSGSFGSLTKLQNYQSFVAVYIFVYISLIVIYFYYRFKIIGLYTGLEIVLAIVGALSIVALFNYPLTKSLWFSFLVGSLVMIAQKRAQLTRNTGRSLAKVYESLPLYTKQCVLHTLIFLLMGLITFHKAPYDFPSVSIFFIALALINFIGEILWNRLGTYLILFLSHEDKKEPVLFESEAILSVGDDLSRKYKFVRHVFMVLFLLSVVLGVLYGFNYQEGEDFSNLNVVVIEKSDPSTFLQVEATLHQMDYFSDQLGYEVSEQGHIWLNFDAHLTERELMNISNKIEETTFIETGYFKTISATPPLLSRTFYTRALSMIMVSILMQWLFLEKQHFFSYVAASFLSFIFFLLLVIVYQLNWTREIVLASWFFPLMMATTIIEEPRILTEQHQAGIVQSAIYSLTSISLVSVPVLIIVPTRIGIEIAFIMILGFLAIHFAYCFVSAGKQINKEVFHEDETRTSNC
ncbi:MAG TPA: hypothetical protein VIG45_03595 [Erysipelothrix sp.]